jgi:NodT family efflux transporter outer membrane factor (OMF) lipoprotein
MTRYRKARLMVLMAVWSAMPPFAGCVVGPDFRKPAAPRVAGYTPATLPTTTATTQNVAGGEAQRFTEGADIPGDWWSLFHSKPLSDLIDRSLKASPNIKVAQAALAVASENVLAQKGAYYPQLSASFSATRSRTSEEISPTPSNNAQIFSLFTPQVAVSYVPDVFGLNRRTVESLEAQKRQAHFALVAAHITLSSNVAAAAIQEASLRAQIAATRELIAINTNILQILRRQHERGLIGRLDVAAQESQLAQTEATLPPLLKQLAQQRDLLTALSGGFPSDKLPEEFELAGLQLPVELPVSLPSRLIEQRPDVRQAEENLHSASALIGVAVANRLPNITLTADAGTMALAAGRIFSAGSGFWDLGFNLAQPVFDGGTLMHRERAARAAYLQAAEQYRGTVLTAFQNVADVLHALQEDANALKAAAAAKQAASVTLDLATKQYQAGSVGYLALLNAQQTYQQAILSLVQAQAGRYADSAALFLALGGGWWNRADLPQN